MFTWVGAQFDGVLSTYVTGVISALMAAITPIALSAMTLWTALFGWAVLRHEVPDTLPSFLWKVFKIGLILAFALQSGVYIGQVADTANALSTGVARTFLPATADPATVSSPYALLDAFNDRASQLVLDLMKEAGITRLDLVFAAVVTAFGNVIFLCVALFVVTLAKVLLTFVIAVGPLFILALAWRPTARFFDSWLSLLLNAVVLAWFAFFALGLSAYMGGTLVRAIQDQGGFQGSAFNVVAESLKYCIVMVLMAIICFQAPGLASALTGGAAVQQGLQMVQNVLMVTRSRSGGGHDASPATQGGVVRRGVGLPYASGQAMRQAMNQTVGRTASAARRHDGSHDPSPGGRTRIPVYQLAAARGRA